jgi:hypothetical protein
LDTEFSPKKQEIRVLLLIKNLEDLLYGVFTGFHGKFSESQNFGSLKITVIKLFWLSRFWRDGRCRGDPPSAKNHDLMPEFSAKRIR